MIMLTRARGLAGGGGRGLCLIELLRSARGCRVALQPRCHHLSNDTYAVAYHMIIILIPQIFGLEYFWTQIER